MSNGSVYVHHGGISLQLKEMYTRKQVEGRVIV